MNVATFISQNNAITNGMLFELVSASVSEPSSAKET